MDFMRNLPDKCIDLVLTDPPYGLKIDGARQNFTPAKRKQWRRAHDFKNWDSCAPEDFVFREIHRVAKNVILFGANYFCDKLQSGYKGWMVWDKGQYGLTMSDGELIYSTFSHPLRIIQCNKIELNKDGVIHPTQKPLKLITEILKEHTKTGNIVFDPFSGSGTTAIACHNLGLDFICVEKDPDYHAASVARLKKHRQQMFLPFDLHEVSDGAKQADLFCM